MGKNIDIKSPFSGAIKIICIENKEKYRLLYGEIDSNPDYDLDISEAVWKEKGRNK